jgi:hypothetical protein
VLMGGVGWWYQLTSAWMTVDAGFGYRTVQDMPCPTRADEHG